MTIGVQRSRGFGRHELFATDPRASAAFYSDLFDLTLDPRQVEPGYPPGWLSFLAVADAEIAAARCVELGSTMTRTADLHDGIWTATLEHPAAGPFGLAAGDSETLTTPITPGRDPGVIGWHQLDTPDPAGASEFFSRAFGWTTEPTAVDGVNVLRGSMADTRPEIATLTTAPASVPAHWLVYVAVTDLAEVIRRATELGALIVVEQTLLPPVGAVCVIRDLDGISFACYQP